MLNARIGMNTGSDTYTIPEDFTIRQAFEEAGIDYEGKAVILNGGGCAPGVLDKTFRELGMDGTPGHDRVFLSAISKVDNA